MQSKKPQSAERGQRRRGGQGLGEVARGAGQAALIGLPVIFMAYDLLMQCMQSVGLTLGLTLVLGQHVEIAPHLLSLDLLLHPGNCGKVPAPELLLAAILWYQAEAQLAQTLISLSLQGKIYR